jgi:ethanolamine ammonia-lyase large subunit
MRFFKQIGLMNFNFLDLKDVLAKASPRRSADELAGIAARSEQERVAAQMVLADLPLKTFLQDDIIPSSTDEVTRLLLETHSEQAFKPLARFTVGDLREWLLHPETDENTLRQIHWGLTPEMVAAVSKIMRNQDLIAVAKKCRVITKFRNTLGLEGCLNVRLQPNHPTDDAKGIAASILDGLLLGSGDAVIGINPAQDSPSGVLLLLELMDRIRTQWDIPTQTCVLTHVSTQINLIEKSAPLDLIFQSIGGTEALNKSFGIDIKILHEALDAARSLKRGTLGNQVMYFETGQGSALSANAHHGVDAQTCEARAYGLARVFDPLLINSVVGFIGPEYLYDGKQIIRAGLEDHFCAKVLGLPMGVDVCYTNHAEADQNDMDVLLTLLGVAGCNYIMGVPGADDIMLNYQSSSFHDALYLRKVLNLKPAPEFHAWLETMKIFAKGHLLPPSHNETLAKKLLVGLK